MLLAIVGLTVPGCSVPRSAPPPVARSATASACPSDGPVTREAVDYVSFSDERALWEAADVVAIVTVPDPASRVVSEDGIPVTIQTVHVERSLRGRVGPTLDIAQRGGTLGCLRYEVSDFELFEQDAHALLFLASGLRNGWRLLTPLQGRYDVVGATFAPRAGNTVPVSGRPPVPPAAHTPASGVTAPSPG